MLLRNAYYPAHVPCHIILRRSSLSNGRYGLSFATSHHYGMSPSVLLSYPILSNGSWHLHYSHYFFNSTYYGFVGPGWFIPGRAPCFDRADKEAAASYVSAARRRRTHEGVQTYLRWMNLCSSYTTWIFAQVVFNPKYILWICIDPNELVCSFNIIIIPLKASPHLRLSTHKIERAVEDRAVPVRRLPHTMCSPAAD